MAGQGRLSHLISGLAQHLGKGAEGQHGVRGQAVEDEHAGHIH